MELRRRTIAVAACLAMIAGGSAPVSLHAERRDTEEDLQPRIQRENNPVKKAKYEIRLARVKLLHASGACQKDDHQACKNLLDSYLDLVRNSWKHLKSASKNAVKHPSGFREMDIALREDARILEDSKRELPLEDRATFDSVITEVNKIHDQVFAELFPSASPRPPGKKPGQAQFVPGAIE